MELCCSGVLSGGGGGATRAAPRPRRTQKLGKRGVSVSSPGFSLARPNRRRGCRPQLEPRAPPFDERKPAGAESVVHMLKSAAGPAEPLELFKSVAQQANIVHTTESCNYMLELTRAHGRVGDMAQVFDLMQRQIIKANVSTFATIFRGLGVQGGLRSAPVALPVMKDAGIILNAYTYNGLIYFLLKPEDLRMRIKSLGKWRMRGASPMSLPIPCLQKVLCDAGRLSDAKDVFWKMKASDQKPDRVTYITLLDKFGDNGDSQSVMEIWNAMKADGYNDNVVAYTAVVW